MLRQRIENPSEHIGFDTLHVQSQVSNAVADDSVTDGVNAEACEFRAIGRFIIDDGVVFPHRANVAELSRAGPVFIHPNIPLPIHYAVADTGRHSATLVA